MSDITFSYTPNDDGKTVSVVYTYADITHERSVNAVLTEGGDLDTEATEQRISEVGLGVKNKIDIGAITNASADPEPGPAPDPEA